MESTTFILVMSFWGIFTLIGVGISFYALREAIKRKKRWISTLGALAFSILVTFSPAYCLYIVANKFCVAPNPSCQKEVLIDGKTLIQYQDTTHFCDANDKLSPCFMGTIPKGGTPSKADICKHCGKNYTYHNTHKEQRYFNLMVEISDGSNLFINKTYCLRRHHTRIATSLNHRMKKGTEHRLIPLFVCIPQPSTHPR